MAPLHRIDDERSAAALADLLNGNSRRRPVVVVTIPAGHGAPWIDAEEIAREAGDLAEVHLMQTGSATWEFSHRMAEGTQVFGGAGRVYPVGHAWASDLTKSPLHFAFSDEDGHQATQELISDALRMAAAAGLLQQRPTKEVRTLCGVVKNTVAGRALVEISNLMLATVAEELTLENVPIQRLVRVGQQVEGRYDSESRRLDVTQSLRPATEALAGYAVGDVVLARVAMVRAGKAELVLYPRTSTPEVLVAVLRADVTTNPHDDLRTLMTVGEVIPARVVAAGPKWGLSLNDVDDDEPIVDAPALLAGGPPWLVEENLDDAEVAQQRPVPAALPMPTGVLEPEVVAPEIVAPEVVTPEAPAKLRPTPAIFDRNRPRPAPATSVRTAPAAGATSAPAAGATSAPAAVDKTAPAGGDKRPCPAPTIFDKSRTRPTPPPAAVPVAVPQTESTRGLLLKVDGLAAEVERLKRQQNELHTQIRADADQINQLGYLYQQAKRQADKADHDLRQARVKLRKAGKARVAPAPERPRFADREEGFRYLVLTQWATRTLPSEQLERPLPDYIIGPRFLDSLDKLEGVADEKVAEVVFQIVTDLAPKVASREVHQLRIGPGGSDPIRTRDDGAVCWRASLQVKTPSARRIHYWVLPTKTIELARVATHDDFDA